MAGLPRLAAPTTTKNFAAVVAALRQSLGNVSVPENPTFPASGHVCSPHCIDDRSRCANQYRARTRVRRCSAGGVEPERMFADIGNAVVLVAFLTDDTLQLTSTHHLSMVAEQ